MRLAIKSPEKRPSSCRKIVEREGLVKRKVNDSGEIQVPVTTVDEFVLSDPLFDIGIIKVDAENKDIDVLLGAERTIDLHKPTIIAEVGGGTYEAFAAFFSSFFVPRGYAAIRPNDSIDAVTYYNLADYTETFEEFLGISHGRVMANDVFLVPRDMESLSIGLRADG